MNPVVLDLTADVLSRFTAKIDKHDGCWFWSGSRSKGGYGTFNVGASPDGYRYALAHRLSYQIHVGPIPAGMQIDHLCRVRHCVNPAHLEVVTQRENILRGESPTARHARQTHCPNGHPYDTRRPDGSRQCRGCYLLSQSARNARVRDLRAAERRAAV